MKRKEKLQPWQTLIYELLVEALKQKENPQNVKAIETETK